MLALGYLPASLVDCWKGLPPALPAWGLIADVGVVIGFVEAAEMVEVEKDEWGLIGKAVEVMATVVEEVGESLVEEEEVVKVSEEAGDGELRVGEVVADKQVEDADGDIEEQDDDDDDDGGDDGESVEVEGEDDDIVAGVVDGADSDDTAELVAMLVIMTWMVVVNPLLSCGDTVLVPTSVIVVCPFGHNATAMLPARRSLSNVSGGPVMSWQALATFVCVSPRETMQVFEQAAPLMKSAI